MKMSRHENDVHAYDVIPICVQQLKIGCRKRVYEFLLEKAKPKPKAGKAFIIPAMDKAF